MPYYEKTDLAMSRLHLICLAYLRQQPDYDEFAVEDVKDDEATVIALINYQQENKLKVTGRRLKSLLMIQGVLPKRTNQV